MRPRILVAESAGMSRDALARLEEIGEVVAADLDRSALLDSLEEVAVLWVRLRNRIDAEVLDRAPKLRVIATPTTGLDHIDLHDASQRGIRVISLQDSGGFLKEVRGTAEFTIGLMLSLLRRIPDAARDVETGHWNRDAFKGRELHRKTIGIVGYGRLGKLVAGYLHAFGAHVIACDPKREHDERVQLVPLQDLLGEADIITLHVNLTDETRKMIGREAFARMKPGAILINTSRGEVIDDAALLEALKSGHLAGAALDVITGESASGVSQHPLIGYARSHGELIITPHIGGCTHESMAMTEVFLARRVREAIGSLASGR